MTNQFINKEDEFISSEQKESKMEEITVERVSQFGVMVGGNWINGDKALGIDFKNMFHAGDVLSIVKNGKGFITSAELVTKAPEKKPWTGGSKFGGSSGKSEFRTTEQIIRSVAAEAAFESPVLAEQTKNMSKEEAVKYTFDIAEHIATWIEKGV